eukprot:765233-Hanusia_phi.AAC.2
MRLITAAVLAEAILRNLSTNSLLKLRDSEDVVASRITTLDTTLDPAEATGIPVTRRRLLPKPSDSTDDEEWPRTSSRNHRDSSSSARLDRATVSAAAYAPASEVGTVRHPRTQPSACDVALPASGIPSYSDRP